MAQVKRLLVSITAFDGGSLAQRPWVVKQTCRRTAILNVAVLGGASRAAPFGRSWPLDGPLRSVQLSL